MHRFAVMFIRFPPALMRALRRSIRLAFSYAENFSPEVSLVKPVLIKTGNPVILGSSFCHIVGAGTGQGPGVAGEGDKCVNQHWHGQNFLNKGQPV
jgi:hypothetical protein